MVTKNPLAQHKTFAEKHAQYMRDISSCGELSVAYCDDGTTRPLASVPVERVEFIGGLWRVQNTMDYEITHVRDREFILGEKLPRQENTFFEYYRAMRPSFNCYGLIFVDNYSMVVAKYTTPSGTHWGYGNNIEQARAFLGIRLYDEYKDLIHNALCQQNHINKK